MNSKTRSLVLIGAASYPLAWFVPVVEGGTNLTMGTLPGWEAFRAALSPIWPYEALYLSAWYVRPAWYESLLYVVSGLTNFVLVGALVRIIITVDRPHPFLRSILYASGAINALFLLFPDRGPRARLLHVGRCIFPHRGRCWSSPIEQARHTGDGLTSAWSRRGLCPVQ